MKSLIFSNYLLKIDLSIFSFKSSIIPYYFVKAVDLFYNLEPIKSNIVIEKKLFLNVFRCYIFVWNIKIFCEISLILLLNYKNNDKINAFEINFI
jgi:hypothetical protein